MNYFNQGFNASMSHKILIVDDEPDNIRMLAKSLTGDYKIIGATSGREAIECAACGDAVDLILLDIVMPEMDGYEVLRKLKADKKTWHIPVICVTVMGEDINELRGFELGAVDYVSRPFSPLTVSARVRTHLELKHCRDHLEHIVRERTRALEQSNKRLRAEIMERKRTEKQLHLKIVQEAEMEKQLRQAQKLEALGTLAGGIAHDFNNILYIILGYSEIAMDNLPCDSKPFECLEQVIQAGKRGADLVNQILTFGRAKDQKAKPMRTQPVLKESLKLLRSSLPSTIEIRQQIDDACGPVLADPTQIHQIIMNLCTNAYHAIGGNAGVLEVSLAETEIDEQWSVSDGHFAVISEPSRPTRIDGKQRTNKKQTMAPGRYMRLAVKDTGRGMDEATMERIFDPYFTTKKIGQGTGLGLFMVYGIVQEHGGAIRVDSTPGLGTRFDIFFPLSQVKDILSDESGTYSPLPKGAGQILMVDDEAQIVRMNGMKLNAKGYVTQTHTSSIKALEAFRADPDHFDLVITDLTMANLTGIQLAHEVFRIRPDMPVILCTGSNDTVTKEQARSAGIREYLRKPLAEQELERAVHRVLGKGDLNI